MSKYLFFAVNVSVIAVVFAFVEILLEKEHGWGSGWNKANWYAKPFMLGNSAVALVVSVFNFEWPLVYHVFVDLVILPTIFLAEYLFIQPNAALLLSCFFGVLLLEDFLWFVFNWHFYSLRQLLKGPHGSIWWHKKWLQIGPKSYLPVSYLSAAIITGILLTLS